MISVYGSVCQVCHFVCLLAGSMSGFLVCLFWTGDYYLIFERLFCKWWMTAIEVQQCQWKDYLPILDTFILLAELDNGTGSEGVVAHSHSQQSKKNTGSEMWWEVFGPTWPV